MIRRLALPLLQLPNELERKMAERQDKEKWESKIVVDNPHFQVLHRPNSDKPSYAAVCYCRLTFVVKCIVFIIFLIKRKILYADSESIDTKTHYRPNIILD